MLKLLASNTKNNKTMKKGWKERNGVIDTVKDNITNSKDAVISTVDKTGATILNNVNEVLASDQVDQTTKQAAQDTSDILKRISQNMNEKLDNPETKAEIGKAIENIGDMSSLLVKAMKDPVNEAINNTAGTIQNAAPKLGAAVTKTAWDMAGALPPLNILIEGINVVNDLTKAASAVAKATTEISETTSNAIGEVKKNLLKELDEKKKISQQISNRTVDSIREFENPNTNQVAGNRKTRRRFFKSKVKTKRVRFLI